MNQELSKGRLYAMRFLYLFTAVFVGIGTWPELINQGGAIQAGKPWDLIYGVAYSFYAAYALLFFLGVRFPLKMLPLLLHQLLYKTTWLIAVAYPLWSAGRLNPEAIGVIRLFSLVVILDLMVIPWPYVSEKYVKAIFTFAATRASLLNEHAGPSEAIEARQRG